MVSTIMIISCNSNYCNSCLLQHLTFVITFITKIVIDCNKAYFYYINVIIAFKSTYVKPINTFD